MEECWWWVEGIRTQGGPSGWGRHKLERLLVKDVAADKELFIFMVAEWKSKHRAFCGGFFSLVFL